MKALFFTDVHTSEGALKWVGSRAGLYDAVIVGGDLASAGNQKYVTEFLSVVVSANPRVYFVPGNADRPDTLIPDGVTQLHGKTTKVGSYTVGGLGGSNRTPFNTPFELDDKEASAVLSSLGKVDLLVSHCPPSGTKCDRTPGGHVGSLPVRKYVEKHRPALVLSGHAHQARAIDNLGGTTVVNPGPLMDGNFAEVKLGSLLSVELKEEALPSGS